MNRDSWLGVEVRHFAALAAIESEGSFRGAADRLGYVQSAVSQQIAHLERLVGARLLERSRGHTPVYLTPQGELLLHHARSVLANITAAQADLDRLGEGQIGTLRVGLLESVATQVMPKVLKAFGRRWPAIEVIATECSTDRPILEQIENGTLDLGFAYLPLEPGPFTWFELLRTPTVLAVVADSPLARAKHAPELDEIARLPLIASRRCRLRSGLEERLLAAHGSLNVVFRTDSDQTAQALVAAGLGVAVMPKLAVDPGDDRIAVVALDDRLPATSVGLISHRERQLTPAAKAFREMAGGVCMNLADPLGDAADTGLVS